MDEKNQNNQNQFDQESSAPEQTPDVGGEPADGDTVGSAGAGPEGTASSPSEPVEKPEAQAAPAEDGGYSDSDGGHGEAVPEGTEEDTGNQPDSTPSEPVTAYRWTYSDQKAHDASIQAASDGPSPSGKQASSRGGKNRTWLWVYALIMTGVFAVSFGILIGVLFVGKSSSGSSINTSYGTVENDPVSAADVQGVEECKNSVVVIEVTKSTGAGTGTGIVMTENGYIATNHHVIEDCEIIRVTFYDGSQAYATLVGSSAMDDLAVIKVEKTGLTPATFADSSQCYVGQTVYAIGTPAGAEFAWTTNKGIISYVNREIKQYNSDGTLAKKLRLLQTDAKVNPGNSGGPLVNADGQVVGIVSMKLSGSYEGIGFAIPSDGAIEILEAIIKYGNADSVNSTLSFKRPVLGITGVYVEEGHSYIMDNVAGVIYDLEDRDADALAAEILKDGGSPSDPISSEVSGVLVVQVDQSLGAKDVLKEGDIIVSVGGETFSSMSALASIINEFYAGDSVTLEVYRDGERVLIPLVLSAQSD
jgi:serine protease Do